MNLLMLKASVFLCCSALNDRLILCFEKSFKKLRKITNETKLKVEHSIIDYTLTVHYQLILCYLKLYFISHFLSTFRFPKLIDKKFLHSVSVCDEPTRK